MSFSYEPPLTRRAAREAARATGEQPTVEPTASGEVSAPVDTPERVIVEPPVETGIIGPDGQIMSRRRLRELRDQEARTGVGSVISAPPAAPERTDSPVVAPSAAATPAATVAEPEPTLEPELTGEPEITATVESTSEPVRSAWSAPEPKPEWTAPDGHWTRQLELEDDEEALETTYSREVGSANPTTSALIIPDAALVMDLGGPLDATGEILLTGSIPLSPSLATTGSVERLSDSDADRDDHFDDRRLHHTAQDAQPVRAAAVASQHALGTPIVSDGKHRGGRGLTVLLIAASALAVVVTGLIITAIALKWI